MGIYYSNPKKSIVACYREFELPGPYPPHVDMRDVGDECSRAYSVTLRQVFEYDPLTNEWDLLSVESVDDIEADMWNLGFYQETPKPDFLNED